MIYIKKKIPALNHTELPLCLDTMTMTLPTRNLKFTYHVYYTQQNKKIKYMEEERVR